jgi:hypothetical protein
VDALGRGLLELRPRHKEALHSPVYRAAHYLNWSGLVPRRRTLSYSVFFGTPNNSQAAVALTLAGVHIELSGAHALESDNRMCLCSFMAAEYDDLPEAVKKEVQTFADVNVAWLSKVLSAAAVVSSEESERRARAIFAAVAGAQLIARSRSDISLYDALIESYRVAGLLPA